MVFAKEQKVSSISLGVPSPSTTKTPPKTKTDEGIKNMINGSIAGMTGKLVEYPFDTVKTRLQAQPSDHKIFKGPLDCFQKTLKNENIWGLYRGMSSPMVGAMLENAMLFLMYNQIQMMIKEYTTPVSERHRLNNFKDSSKEIPLSMTQLCLAGAISGTCASFLLTPVELIKCKLQVQETFTYGKIENNNNNNNNNIKNNNIIINSPKISSQINNLKSISKKTTVGVTTNYTGPISVIKHTIIQHGIPGFYRGHSGTLVRETIGGAIWFGTYEFVLKLFMKRKEESMLMNNISSSSSSLPSSSHSRLSSSPSSQLLSPIKKTDLSAPQLMMAGACAGMAYNLLIFPADSIKSQIQTDEEIMQATGKKIVRRGFFKVGRDIFKSDGIPGFYRGCGITVARAAPSSAIIFMTYELLTRQFS